MGSIQASGTQIKKDLHQKRTIHEFIYDFLKGNLTSVKILKHEKFGWQYIIELSNVGDNIELTIPADSKYGDSFVTKLPNLKLGAYYSIKPYNFEDKEKRNKKGEPFSFKRDLAADWL